MRNLRAFILASLVSCFIAAPASADKQAVFHQRVSSFERMPTASHARHARRAFKVARGVCKKYNIPHFEVQLPNGQKRLVMNVHGQKNLAKYKKVFSKQFMENFFTASAESKPNWSYLRVGAKTYNQFGTGSQYRTSFSSKRVAFPYSVSKEEMAARLDAIENTPNPPFDYQGQHVGGIFSGKFLRNCTDWLTSVVGNLTGIKTNSVIAHAAGLWDGRASERMTVQAIITPRKIDNFGAEALQRSW